jgi:putative transposase
MVKRRETRRGGGIVRIFAPKIALDPNDAQKTYFRKSAGIARFAYHWALAEGHR